MEDYKEKLIESLRDYMRRNYIEMPRIHYSISIEEPPQAHDENELDEIWLKEHSKTQCIRLRLKAFLSREKIVSFGDKLQEWMDRKGLTGVELYKAVHMDRRLFSKILTEQFYHPSKNTAVLLALAMRLTSSEAREFVQMAGYYLSKEDKRDLIISFCFEEQVYDVMIVNELLHMYDCSPLMQ